MKLAAAIKTIEKIKLQEKDLRPLQNRCPLCGNPKQRQKVAVLQQEPIVEVLFCPNCYGYAASRLPTNIYLKQFYIDYYSLLIEDDNKEQVTLEDSSRFARHILQYLSFNTSLSTIKILDFGGGDGALAKAIAQQLLQETEQLHRVTIDIVDWSVQTIEQTPALTIQTYQKIADLPAGAYHLILASAIIEHIPKVKETMGELLQKLHEDAYLYVRTPCIMPLKKLIPPVPYLYPMHLHDLGASFWNRLPERHAWKGKITISQPAIVMTTFSSNPLMTSIAHILKAPAYIERYLRNQPKDFIWNYVGGWEAIFKKQ